MSEKCKKDDWVEIHYVVLEARERTGDIPEDTRKVPLECWIKGWAEKEMCIRDRCCTAQTASPWKEPTLPIYTRSKRPVKNLSTGGS